MTGNSFTGGQGEKMEGKPTKGRLSYGRAAVSQLFGAGHGPRPVSCAICGQLVSQPEAPASEALSFACAQHAIRQAAFSAQRPTPSFVLSQFQKVNLDCGDREICRSTAMIFCYKIGFESSNDYQFCIFPGRRICNFERLVLDCIDANVCK